MSVHIHSIKSKDSRRKLRRWTFDGVVTRPDGTKAGAHMPGVLYGDYAEAAKLTERISEAYAKNDAAMNMEVSAVPHETVSIETKRQFEGMNDQSQLVAQAALMLATELKVAAAIIDKEPDEIVREMMEKARALLFPRLDDAIKKVKAIEDTNLVVEQPVPAEPEDKQRKRGVEAVREALAGLPTAEGAACAA